MDFNVFVLVVLAYSNISIKTSVCQRRHSGFNSVYYYYERPEPYKPDSYDSYDYEESRSHRFTNQWADNEHVYYSDQGIILENEPEYFDDQIYDKMTYNRNDIRDKRKKSSKINNFKVENLILNRGIAKPKSKGYKHMLHITDLNDLLKTHGTGKIPDPETEEKVSVTEKRKQKKHKVPDGLGRSLNKQPCGQTNILGSRVVGGADALEGAHPWIVAILKNGELFCSGSIINNNWILTAAHCFMDEPPEQNFWSIRVGTINRLQGRVYKIKKVITHERFNFEIGMMNSDIALMMVSKPIEFNKLVAPICLPDNSYDEPRAKQLIVAGWGNLKFQDENIPVMLQDVTLDVISDIECFQKYKRKRYKLYKSQLCTFTYKKDACQGDSGGPAVEVVEKKATLVGIVSYGSRCADIFPGVYTQVSYYLKWIYNKTHLKIN